MIKNILAFVSFLILILAVCWSFYQRVPHPDLDDPVPVEDFSVARAYNHVQNIAQAPHYVGSAAHSRVRNYLVRELEALGLLVETQEGIVINGEGIVTRPQNILARIQGSGRGKSLLIMTHYDSAMHSSFGASDAGSGVSVILEGIRAFMASGAKPLNDIIILFTDAEELGLNGAALFVSEHPWAEEVGVALNFEARGSGGSSFMFLEPTLGNRELIRHFIEADIDNPVSNSLVYSIYKMLPNDTDLTVLREQGGINGFNFAFIDDHYDYHTALDIPENLDKSSLAHHGNYLMPLLEYFSRIPLEEMNSDEELVFFDIPIAGIVAYPYSWIPGLLMAAGIGLMLLLGTVLYQKKASLSEILIGAFVFFISLLMSGGLTWGLWELVLLVYPEYQEMEHGFTYNGYWYIGAVIFLSLGLNFYIYNFFRRKAGYVDLFLFPLFFWFGLCVLFGIYLKGGSYFVIPLIFGLLQIVLMLVRPRWLVVAQSLLSLPAVFILLPFILMLPVAMGLQMLVVTAILTTLLFVLLWPVFGLYSGRQLLGFLSLLTFFVLSIIAHFKSDFSEDRPKPNSLVYLLDETTGIATWNTYDAIGDAYTASFINDSTAIKTTSTEFESKYNSGFESTALAPTIAVPSSSIRVNKVGTPKAGLQRYQVNIAPNREVDRMDLYTDLTVDFEEFKVNGKTAPYLKADAGSHGLHIFRNRWTERLLTYYPVSRDTLRLDIVLKEGSQPVITVFEASYDLHEEPRLQVHKRGTGMIPRPFVINDAVITKKEFALE